MSRFPELFGEVNQIDGAFNNYWGNQRILLHIDINEKKESFQQMQTKVVEVNNEARATISQLENSLQGIAEKLNDS